MTNRIHCLAALGVVTLCFFSFCTISQDTIVTYYDSNWNEATSADFEYYRKAFKNANRKWQVWDFYKDGNFYMIGTYKNKKLKIEDGFFSYYYPNGEIKETVENSSGKKDGNLLAGHEGGQIKQVESYTNDLEEGEWTTYFEYGKLKSQGLYKNGEKEGKWIFYFENGQKRSELEYVSGLLISESYWNKDGGTPKKAEVANWLPHFIGGDAARLKYLNENIRYPIEARMRGIQGRVFVTFIVEKDGSITNARVLKGIGGGCDEEAIRVIKEMPKWVPGNERGKPVPVEINMPILFRLNKVTKKGNRRP